MFVQVACEYIYSLIGLSDIKDCRGSQVPINTDILKTKKKAIEQMLVGIFFILISRVHT